MLCWKKTDAVKLQFRLSDCPMSSSLAIAEFGETIRSTRTSSRASFAFRILTEISDSITHRHHPERLLPVSSLSFSFGVAIFLSSSRAVQRSKLSPAVLRFLILIQTRHTRPVIL